MPDLSVRIAGSDDQRQRFWQTTGLLRVTPTRIRIHAVPGCCRVGDVLTVSYQKQTANYRIELVDHNDDAELVAITPGTCIFPSHLLARDVEVTIPDTKPPDVQPVPPAFPIKSFVPAEEKRRFARIPLRVPVLVSSRPMGSAVFGMTADVSAGGCYVELAAPMAVDTEVEVTDPGGAAVFRATGRVITSHPMVGMGIAFDKEQHDIEQRLFSASPVGAQAGDLEAAEESAAPLQCAENLLLNLLKWFAENPTLDRHKFFEIVHECDKARNKPEPQPLSAL